ncbi:carbohydrate ABC transporter permease [Ensifer adhaerens]|uniref:carbohydrate ABC transporter permease n=1 Tax=Ensifer adhaerens TaxID=106592 RepID=UPI001C4DF042|nr:sugar ABC transporter permease [Ensifer adhaerens]MBW0370877.1 sugar ABC transporter permease [Ensifer adhaerens]UCM24374.1 sugar ABC transporter permease [Ensifer adhaerens]
MRSRTFYAFVAPSLALMFIFIALPLVSVAIQSFQLTQQVFEQVTTETCTPGFLKQSCVQEVKNLPKLDANGRPIVETRFVGLDVYRTVLQPAALVRAFSEGGNGFASVLNIDFYKALRFTLTFTLVTLPLVIGMGLAIALAINSTMRSIRGPLIFVSLLPFIITPVIGALSIRWLFVGDGIMTALIAKLTGQHIAVFAHGWMIELLMMFYRVWHVAPFAFVIFYAGLQTVDRDTLESAVVDGASRFERLRYVIVPHLMPLIVFVSLIHLMDAYRAFDEVIGFSSQAHRISLQWLTYNYLIPDNSGNRSISRASASSMLTMIGIIILLLPLLRRTWREHRSKR